MIAPARLLAALAPLAEQADVISIPLAGLATAVFAAWLAGLERLRAWPVARLLLAGPRQAIGDGHGMVRRLLAEERMVPDVVALAVWIVPLLLGALFAGLFFAANPLIRLALAQIDPARLLAWLDPGRLGFWLAAAVLVWPFVWLRAVQPLAASQAQPPGSPGLLFGPAAIARSLLLFNALFALQSVLDIAYLWGGAALPAGISYATYAHNGAYPLMATALLAAGFVLAALRAGSEASPLLRWLIALWIGQNILLVASAMLRLDLYVAAYSLTLLRVAAFLWMGLVAAGLALILARIALARPNSWLVGANLCTLAFTLWAASLADLDGLVARYNVAHCREISGAGTSLDVDYLVGLGPGAIPAFDRFIALQPVRDHDRPLREQRQRLADRFAARPDDWRGWSFRDARLAAYLSTHPGDSAAPLP